jgi:hypothetical protein
MRYSLDAMSLQLLSTRVSNFNSVILAELILALLCIAKGKCARQLAAGYESLTSRRIIALTVCPFFAASCRSNSSVSVSIDIVRCLLMPDIIQITSVLRT